MDAFPAFIPLRNARIVIVGDGEAAEAKARLFAGSPARVVRVAEAEALIAEQYEGARLVFVAVADGGLAADAAAIARVAGALVNVVDRVRLSDFASPAIVDRSPVLAAIVTGGTAPVLATLLRSELETRWPEGLGRVAALAGALQARVRKALPDAAARRAYWRRLLHGPAAESALAGDMEQAERLAVVALEAPRAMGRVLFLQPPTRTDLLSLAAVRALAAADRIVCPPGSAPETIAFARRDAMRHDAAAPADLAAWAEAGETTVVVSASPAGALAAVRTLGVTAEQLPVAKP